MKTPVGCLAIIALIVLIEAGLAWLVQLLWNSLVRMIFPDLPVIDYWAAVGIMVVLSIVGNFFRSNNSK